MVYKNEGIIELFKMVAKKLWPKVTISKIVEYNGVIVSVTTKKLLFSSKTIHGNPFQEEGLAAAHRKFTQPGDRVITIGGGKGVTAVIASTLVGIDGSVTVYEGGYESFKTIKHTIKLNRVEDICQVNHAIVGSDINVYGGDVSFAKKINPEDLADCDVLELDCEGSEYTILENLAIRPRIIIVEIHPERLTDYPQDFILTQLKNLGYKVVYQSGHDGVELEDNELEELLYRNKNYYKNKTLKHLNCGARWPVVVAGVNTTLNKK